MNQPDPMPEPVSPDAQPADMHPNSPAAKLRIAFFGTNGTFSHSVLKQMHPELLNIRAIFCDASEPFHPHLGFDLHQLHPPAPLGPGTEEIELHTKADGSTATITDIGWKHDIPVYSIGRIRSQAVADTLAAHKVDVVCVACFNKRIPRSLLAVPRLGFLNLHPSILPDYRGPEPIQWILHEKGQGGVTIHWMDENFDTGDIAYQESFDFSSGTDYFAAERICATEGAIAYMHVLIELMKGNVPRTPQGDGGFYRGRLGYLP